MEDTKGTRGVVVDDLIAELRDRHPVGHLKEYYITLSCLFSVGRATRYVIN